MKYIKKHLLMVIAFTVSISGIVAQTVQDNEKLSRKEKKAVKKELLYQSTKQMLEDKSFVLESDFLQTRNGDRLHVSSLINFIMVDSDQAVIQIGSNTGLGFNGVGGVTAKGKITKWELKENKKKKTFDLAMHIQTSIGMYDVYMSVGSFGATARLTGLRPGDLLFSGNMVDLEESLVYEGQSL